MSEDVLRERVDDYCARYKVEPNEKGLPPFPAGRRETRQHREWISLLKADTRLRRRIGGLCRRCSQPAAPGRIFCALHERSSADMAPATSNAVCLVCGQAVAGAAVDQHRREPLAEPVVVHHSCAHVISLAQKVGPALLDRVRHYLWPERRSGTRRRQLLR